ncbi:indole-3-glycerol phosphate synthase TrpC [uncultured Bacteroides sp.]|uniref:indole-3-glycerol phosphate synthase TrpC n=1 Tax=uncultured Bacteroides sp. TaxID=162156 RepID=UPI002623C44F|nr:indole-3-glycerol phosphate synthase TrpC [uncultured Bacteroides sp.]
MSKDILEEIIAAKRIEVARQQEAVPFSQLETQLPEIKKSRSMHDSLAASPYGIISEFKRRSPSKGWIKQEGDSAIIPQSYERAGASALSILTDEPFFGGNMEDIKKARPTVSLPILRKDFIVSEYQLLQAKIIGADAVLLIAAALTKEECRQLAKKAQELKLEVLLELHSEPELDYVNEYVDMVGVNNRNLGTFHTDVENSFRLAKQLPQDTLLVSESGISNPKTIKQLRDVGFRGFLIGETFMKTSDPGETLRQFIKEIES